MVRADVKHCRTKSDLMVEEVEEEEEEKPRVDEGGLSVVSLLLLASAGCVAGVALAWWLSRPDDSSKPATPE